MEKEAIKEIKAYVPANRVDNVIEAVRQTGIQGMMILMIRR